jgi:hypothetical protein
VKNAIIYFIKNKNLYNIYTDQLKQKEIFTINEGYNYIIIVDKNYTNINL